MASHPVLLGYDLGSSSVKVTLMDAVTGERVGSAHSPTTEMKISSPKAGWAEQDPGLWWNHALLATREALSMASITPGQIEAIGISYQMHGLVVVNAQQTVLRPSIIWCDSRAIQLGDNAFSNLGSDYCLSRLLNSPGNFTASKLRWIKENEPEVYRKIHKIMLPGDYLAMKLTGDIYTTASGLSEGMFWDHQNECISQELLTYYEIDPSLIPQVVPTFGYQGSLSEKSAKLLGINPGIKVCYRSGDQPNNAFSLNALQPGEVATTAGTSGVIYAVSDQPISDTQSRVNTFMHVNHTPEAKRFGVLLCVNGTGIMNSWLKENWSNGISLPYEQLNKIAEQIPIGSEGLRVLPFGNGAERMLNNQNIGASIHRLNFVRHKVGQVSRAIQEGIVYSLGYGFEIIKELNITPSVIRAGKTNMFLSKTFCEAFANVTNTHLELYNADGSMAAARGAGVGKGIYSTAEDSMPGLKCIERYTPIPYKQEKYLEAYRDWKSILEKEL
ncbi:MAG: carbohydrate kinase [Cyclobacteriaceae bacterium]|nr:carbohydrate kinase [Cyclobacteriaceae bacterium]